MNVINTRFDDVKILEPVVFQDERGYFMESYNKDLLKSLGLGNDEFLQDNQSFSVNAGVLRGLHYQLHPKAQAKLIRVISGAIYDVIVDIRKGSPSFGHWQGFILSDSNKRQLYIPKGFAHGFCTIVPNTIVNYKVDEYYSPKHDRGIAWNDPDLSIHWPTSSPILSEKDQKHPYLKDAEIL